MQEIYDNPVNVRGLGNVCREFEASDFHKSNSDIVSGSEIVPDIGEVNVFTMSYFDGNINLIVSERGDFFVGGTAYLDVLVVNSDSLPVDEVSVDLTIDEVTVSETTDSEGKCSFLLDTSGMDTFEYGFLATYERATATFNGEYTIRQSPFTDAIICTFNDNATVNGSFVGSDMLIQFNDGEWQQYNGGKFTVRANDTVRISGVTSLGNFCFSGCERLTSITLPNNITSLGDYCFSNCKMLTSITLPNNITSLGESCFANCVYLNSVILSDNLTSLGSSCFENCNNLNSIVLPNSVSSLGYRCFESNDNLREVIFKSTTPPTIRQNCFMNSYANPTATVPSGTKSAYESALSGKGATFTVIEESEI